MENDMNNLTEMRTWKLESRRATGEKQMEKTFFSNITSSLTLNHETLNPQAGCTHSGFRGLGCRLRPVTKAATNYGPVL